MVVLIERTRQPISLTHARCVRLQCVRLELVFSRYRFFFGRPTYLWYVEIPRHHSASVTVTSATLLDLLLHEIFHFLESNYNIVIGLIVSFWEICQNNIETFYVLEKAYVFCSSLATMNSLHWIYLIVYSESLNQNEILSGYPMGHGLSPGLPRIDGNRPGALIEFCFCSMAFLKHVICYW